MSRATVPATPTPDSGRQAPSNPVNEITDATQVALALLAERIDAGESLAALVAETVGTPEGEILAARLAAVAENDDDNLLAGWDDVSTKTQVQLTDRDRKIFAAAVTHFSGQPRNRVLKRNFPTDQDAQDFRDKIQIYADEHDLSAGLPKFIDGHMSKDVVDKSTGKVTRPAKWIEANKYDPTWNVGTLVVFRFAPHRDTSTANGPVVTSNVADAS